jgi:hypothetical protein
MNSVPQVSKGDYVIGGHKNILRKVVPGQSLIGPSGKVITTVADHNGAPYTMNFAAGKANSADGVSHTAYYLAGWTDTPDLFGDTTIPSYGSCARCHTTGYRFDGTGPEPTAVTGTAPNFAFTKLTDAQFPRVPAGGAAGTTSSWYLTGIQCERCHHADVETANSAYSTPAARISHYPSLSYNMFYTGTVPEVPDWNYAPVYNVGMSLFQLNPPTGNVCYECHRTETAWTPASGVGEVHILPVPSQESLVTKQAPSTGLTGSSLTGQFSAKGACSNSTYKNYADCITNGATWPYTPSMSHGALGAQAFLNSPHARFSGTLDVKYQASPDQSVAMTGTSNSFFVSEYGGGCTGCHDVHGSSVTVNASNTALLSNSMPAASNAFPKGKCVECHSSHGKSMNHPTGPGTPFPSGFDASNGDSSSCVKCHLAGANGTATYHFFRINADVNYTTFPPASTYYANTGSGNYGMLNTYPESYTNPTTYQPGTYQAVGLDVDIACGQCHTGGNGTSNPYGLTAYAGDGGMKPMPYSRAFLASAAVNMHNTAAASPTFNVTLPGFGPATTITISSPDGAAIFYTTDGTQPKVVNNSSADPTTTTQYSPYPVSIPVTKTTTIYAVAAGPQSYGFTPSPVVGGTYGVQVAPKPVISPTNAAIVAPATVSVTITKSLSTGSIYYTTNGTTPTASSTKYTVPIVVSSPEVINAIVIAPNYANSPVATGTFTGTAAAPAFSLNGGLAKYPGTYTGAVQANLTDAAPSLCYTLDGSTPVATATACTHGTTVASGTNIAITASATIKAVAFGSGFSASKVTSGVYAIK